MLQTVKSPTPPSDRLQGISRSEPSPSESARNGLRSVGLGDSCPNRTGESLLAGPEGETSDISKTAVIADLRTRITALERGSSTLAAAQPGGALPHSSNLWTL